MDFETLLHKITPETHGKLRQAIEIGRWADGTPLTDEQREVCLQAMIAWEVRNLPEEERSGYMERNRDGGGCGSACSAPVEEAADSRPGDVHVFPAADLIH